MPRDPRKDIEFGYNALEDYGVQSNLRSENFETFGYSVITIFLDQHQLDKSQNLLSLS